MSVVFIVLVLRIVALLLLWPLLLMLLILLSLVAHVATVNSTYLVGRGVLARMLLHLRTIEGCLLLQWLLLLGELRGWHSHVRCHSHLLLILLVHDGVRR